MAEVAVQEFFEENSLEYEVICIERLNGNMYKVYFDVVKFKTLIYWNEQYDDNLQTLDDRIHLYCCDQFNFHL